MKEKHEELLEKIRSEEQFNLYERLDELEYLDDKDYLDVWVVNKKGEDATLSKGKLIESVEENNQYELKFENIELRPSANQILLEKDRSTFRNKILVGTAILSAIISLVVAYITAIYSSGA